jgi:hypothetical protein
MYLENAATVFQVTRLTGASFIVSTPTHAGRPADASVDPTDARKLPLPVPEKRVLRPCMSIMATGVRRDGLGIGNGQIATLIGDFPYR